MRQQRLQEKLQSVLFSSVNVGENEIKRKFIDQTINVNADYAFVDINLIADNMISVSDNDMKKYYDENPDKFKVVPQRKLKYILFSDLPSAGDSATVKKNMQSVMELMKKDTSSFESFVKIYSSVPYSKDTISLNTLPSEVADKISSASPNSIIGPLSTNEGTCYL